MEPVTTPEPGKPSARFNLGTDWGQVFVGDEFEFVVTLQNAGDDVGGSWPTRRAERRTKLNAPENLPPMTNVVIADELDPAFEVLEATGNGLTIKSVGQRVEATRATLASGEIVTLRIKVRAISGEPGGKKVANQASLTYAEHQDQQFSNTVTVEIMTREQPTATPAPTDVATATPDASPAPAAAGGEPQIAPPEALGSDLPHTSGGLPISGFVLLGLTLLLHSIRAHRERVRI